MSGMGISLSGVVFVIFGGTRLPNDHCMPLASCIYLNKRVNITLTEAAKHLSLLAVSGSKPPVTEHPMRYDCPAVAGGGTFPTPLVCFPHIG